MNSLQQGERHVGTRRVPETPLPPEGRQISGMVAKLILALVEHRAGAAGVRAVLECAGERRPVEELTLAGSWSSYAQGKALFEAAAAVLDDEHIGRAVGERVLQERVSGDLAVVTASYGSPAEVLESVGMIVSKFATTFQMTPRHITDHDAVITNRSMPGYPSYELWCDFTMGLLSQAPVIFGLGPATVREEACEREGADCCRFHVSWNAESPFLVAPERRITQLEWQTEALRARIEAMQATITDLISASDLKTLSERIVDRARSVVRGREFLLTIRQTPVSTPVLYRTRNDDADDPEIVGDLLAGHFAGLEGSKLIVEVASSRRSYGHLVAVEPSGTQFLDQERVALREYASLAAVALDAVTTADELRAQTQAAQALFDLTRDLAAVSSVKEVAYRVAGMVPRVLCSNRVVVWLWDEKSDALRPMGFSGVDPEEVQQTSSLLLCPHESIVLDMMISDHEPVVLGTDVRDPYLENLFDGLLSGCAVLVPIIAGGRFHGVISAAVSEETNLGEDEALLECLRGIADQTSMAFTNARLVERVRHQALHDSLTGLPNQRLFEDRVRSALAAGRRSGEPVGLFFLDLDRFKAINDSLGHGAGDDLLGQVANRLTLALREEDTVARLGGDEFVMLIARAGSIGALEMLAQRIQESLREPFMLSSKAVSISSSIGIVLADATVDDYQSLVRYADVAMYRAKSQGRDRYAVYSPAIDQRGATSLKLETDLERALDNDELKVLYQPVVQLDTMQIVGVEALVRWDHPKLGLLVPESFLPMAEESGLIVPVDAWVLQAACRQARIWADAGFPPLRMSVNLSIQDLRNADLADNIVAVLREHRLDPADFEVEISERVVDHGAPDVIAALDRLKAAGLKLAIDDFGTGGSGLRQLRSLPINTLKIDSTFVQELTPDQAEAPLLAAMISMARDLPVQTVAEGVESVQQGAFLRGRGCDLAQGFFFSHPITAEAVTRLMEQR